MTIINQIAFYLPELVIHNNFFSENYGINNDAIIKQCGIKQRRCTYSNENTNTMAIKSIENSRIKLPYQLNEIDLIIGATYTPYDTIATLAHTVQSYFNIPNAKCFTVNSACSSFINALEIVDAFFLTGKAHKALLVASENNSYYNDFANPKSGFLWGDGAAAIFISKEKGTVDDIEIVDINTKGLGTVGKNIKAISLIPFGEGLQMPFGKDVFRYACNYLAEETEQILKTNDLTLSELDYFIPHQANKRIIDLVVRQLKIDSNKVLGNIELFGNTGSASTPIVLAQNKQQFKKDDRIVISVFGGGYSTGSVLLKKI